MSRPVCMLGWMTLGAVLLCSCTKHAAGTVTSRSFGSFGGAPVTVWTIDNHHGLKGSFTDYGATVTSLEVTNANGTSRDVVLGFDNVNDYVASNSYFGCTVGRVGNRIDQGRFQVDGQQFQVATNNGDHHLHGGERGFDKRLWEGTPITTSRGSGIRFRRVSPDGESGYPGRLDVEVDYILTENNELDVIMTARSQSPTPVNLLHHTYWNLGGHDSGTILDQSLMIDANSYTPGGAIPNGEIVSVENTPYDFRTSTAVGERLGQLPGVGESPGGYDLNYVLEDAQKRTPAATLMDPVSGLRMELFTNQPGLQFYSGNWLEAIVGKGNAVYDQNDGLCLETQAFPDSINKAERSGWQDIVLRPGQVYRHEMTHRFTTVPTAGASSVQGGR